MPYSKAHVVLDAIQFATEADVKSLSQLISSNSRILQLELVLRLLLTYLPESTEPSSYTPFLKALNSGGLSEETDVYSPSSASRDISRDEAKRRIRSLRIFPLDHMSIPLGTTDLLERFIFCRAYRIDSEIGSITFIQELVKQFSQQYKSLAIWAVSTILPLQRLEQQGLQESPVFSLSSLGQLHGRSGLEAILAPFKEHRISDYSNHLRTIVGPWLFGEMIKSDHGLESASKGISISSESATRYWSSVNEWLLDLAGTDYEGAINTYARWNGPADIDCGEWLESSLLDSIGAANTAYQQLGLALIYVSKDAASRSQIEALIRVIAERTQIESPEELSMETYRTYQSTVPDVFLASISNLHLTLGELLDGTNLLTTPSNHSIQFADLSLVSSSILYTLGIHLTIEQTVSLALFGSAVSHWNICSKAIYNLPTICGKDDSAWTSAKEKLLWLRDWNTGIHPGQVRQGIISQVSLDQLHNTILESLVTNGRYKLAIESYCQSSSELSLSKVKDALVNVILASYDNASNGNKTRGGIKKAADIITTFQPHFPGFQRMGALWALIQATHRLSFYSLTLQHGVPLLPVNIRIHPEPLILIDKVLQQNPRSYTKLDDLLDIGKDLVRAGRITFLSANGEPLSEEKALHQVERSITAKAISASLAEDDFDTAYSYIVNRLSSMSSSDSSSNDHLWQAAYQAGRYNSGTVSSTSPSSLRRLEQRMELLSQALLIAPTSSLQEVLSTWRQCEQDLNASLAHELREEDAWQAKGDRTLPGGFSREDIVPVQIKAREHTRRAMDEEAPMGLFDVARGAAAALSKSAFPLRGQAGRTSSETARSDEDTPQRVRKRDMVSNMVTGGLASGIGWVIGAPPVNNDN